MCSGDAVNISYDDVTDTLTLTGLPFDDDPLGADYSAFSSVNGYTVYRNDDPGTFNQYLAIHEETGAIAVGVVAIEGYNDYGYSGAWHRVDDLTTSIPGGDLVQYLGEYGGTLTFQGTGDLYLTDGGNNNTGFSDPRYDEMILKLAPEAKNREERYRIFREAETMLMEQMPILPVYTYTSKHLIHPSVKGLPSNLMDSLNLKYVWLDPDWEKAEQEGDQDS